MSGFLSVSIVQGHPLYVTVDEVPPTSTAEVTGLFGGDAAELYSPVEHVDGGSSASVYLTAQRVFGGNA